MQLPLSRKLANGVKISLEQFLFTYGLCYGVDETGYEYRYCYEDLGQALTDFLLWTGEGDPGGPWIKLKGHPDGERLGPGATK